MREAGLDSDDIEVINPITGSTEYISKDDPSYYDASGFNDTRDPPNQRTFQRFFGGGPPKRLENGPSVKPC